MDYDSDKIIAGVLVLDKELNIIYSNRVFLNIVEYSVKELNEQKFDILNSSFDFVINYAIENEIFTYVNDTIIINTKSGKERYIERHIEFTLDAKENLKEICISCVDISKYKNLEENFLNFQKIETFNEVTKAISLEYNNLLGAIIGFSSFVKSILNPTNEIYRYIDIIESSANKASSLTNQLLSFAGNDYYKQSLLNFNKVVSQNVEIIKKMLPLNIKITTQLNSGDIYLYHNENQLNQIVINTIINAKEALEAGKKGGLIEVETKLENNQIEFFIRDNGIGISKDILQKVFEPYYTTKDINKHSGLGLSVTEGIIKNMGGIISCTSEKGKTEFILSIPYREVHLNDINPGDIEGKGENILVIDDVEAMRNLSSILLQQKNYNPILAESGSEGLKIIENTRIDLILLDIYMPDMNGEEVIDEIRKRHKNIPVILLTGCTEEKIVNRLIKNKATEIITKPFETLNFYCKIRKALDDK